jgi:hypothetical protein
VLLRQLIRHPSPPRIRDLEPCYGAMNHAMAVATYWAAVAASS